MTDPRSSRARLAALERAQGASEEDNLLHFTLSDCTHGPPDTRPIAGGVWECSKCDARIWTLRMDGPLSDQGDTP